MERKNAQRTKKNTAQSEYNTVGNTSTKEKLSFDPAQKNKTTQFLQMVPVLIYA